MAGSDEKTLPLADVVFRFVFDNLRPLLVVGSVTLALAVVVLRLMSPNANANAEIRYVRQNGTYNWMRSMLTEKERQLSVYSSVYAALMKGEKSDDPVVVSARENIRTLMAQIGELRNGIEKYIALPWEAVNEVRNAKEILYQEKPAGVLIQVESAYAKAEPTVEKKNKRLVLAGWVLVNALFAAFLAVRKRDRRSAPRK